MSSDDSDYPEPLPDVKVKKFDEMLALARRHRLRRFLGNRYGREGC